MASVLKNIKFKIPIYVVAFFMFDNFKKCMESLITYKDYLDIKIIENDSKYSKTHFMPYIKDLIKKGIVSEYFYFEKNINNNAFAEVFNTVNFDELKSPYIMVTDGDLEFDFGFLEEEIEIIQKNKEVFCVGTDLYTSNLPKIKGAENWILKPKRQWFKNYNKGLTGIWGLLFKKENFLSALQYIKNEGMIIVDDNLHKYARKRKLVWARTMKNKAWHLTWNNYGDKNNEYAQFKRTKTFDEHWKTLQKCEFVLYTKDNIEKIIA